MTFLDVINVKDDAVKLYVLFSLSFIRSDEVPPKGELSPVSALLVAEFMFTCVYLVLCSSLDNTKGGCTYYMYM